MTISHPKLLACSSKANPAGLILPIDFRSTTTKTTSRSHSTSRLVIMFAALTSRLSVAAALAAVAFVCPSAFGQSCTGLECQQLGCPVGATTSISGTVHAPNGVDPLPNVLVYVPGTQITALDPLPNGIGSGPIQPTNSPLVTTVTAVDGTFTVTNAPVGSNIPLVIQAGKWRRLYNIPSVAGCTNTRAPALSFPTNQSQGDIPKFAIVTGSVDALECALPKIGIATSEFSDPSGTGRVNLYLGAGSPGAQYSDVTPSETELEGTQPALNAYDLVMFPCQGDQFTKSAALQTNIINYANAGGRIFATHFSYVWLYNDPPFSTTADWTLANGIFTNDPATAIIDQTSTTTQQLAQWLTLVGASTNLGEIQLGALRQDFSGVNPPSQLWLSVNDPALGTVPLQYSFDTPVGALPSMQIGTVLYNDYHVEDTETHPTNGETFPKECSASPMSPQEKLLEFMIFNLSDFAAVQNPTVAASATNIPSTFTPGDASDQILLNVTNTSSTIPAGLSLTLTVSLPSGFTVNTIGGTNANSGWSCSGLTCQRIGAQGGLPFVPASVLKPGISDPISLSVAVSKFVSESSATITVNVSGGNLQSNVVVSDVIPVYQVPVVTWPVPASITYGTALSASQLDATTTVPGTFAYNPPAGTVLGVGAQQLSVTFTPTDTTNYATATASVTLQVTQASPTVTWANPAPITYGIPLSSSQLNATSNVPGNFVYLPVAGTVLTAGSQTLQVQFTPTDNTDYKVVSATVPLLVNQASPVITWTQPAPITQGTPLGAAQLDATANVPGSFVYNPPAGTVLSPGMQSLAVMFTPNDMTDYTTSTAAVSILVNALPNTVMLQIATTQYAYPRKPEFWVQVAPLNGKPNPTGTITLYDGIEQIGSYTLAAKMRGLLISSLPNFSVGSHLIQATYSGDTNYSAGLSAQVPVNVTPGFVSLKLACASTTLRPGQTLKCAVNASDYPNPVTGNVDFTITGLNNGLALLNKSGQAVITGQPPSSGTITVTYPAQGNYEASEPVSVNFTVQ